MHSIMLDPTNRDKSKEEILKIACLDQLPGYEETASHYYEFTKEWSGGAKGQVLLQLEEYERSLDVKRKIKPADLTRLASLSMPDAPKYVPAMLKALLNAPGAMVEHGYAEVFNSSDVSSLASPTSNCRKAAVEASRLFRSSQSFLDAYSRFDSLKKLKLLSKFEIDCVMHIHGKRVQTRQSYNSLTACAWNFYTETKKSSTLSSPSGRS